MHGLLDELSNNTANQWQMWYTAKWYPSRCVKWRDHVSEPSRWGMEERGTFAQLPSVICFHQSNFPWQKANFSAFLANEASQSSIICSWVWHFIQILEEDTPTLSEGLASLDGGSPHTWAELLIQQARVWRLLMQCQRDPNKYTHILWDFCKSGLFAM